MHYSIDVVLLPMQFFLSVINQENHVFLSLLGLKININKTCSITFSCSFWVKPLVALPAEL